MSAQRPGAAEKRVRAFVEGNYLAAPGCCVVGMDPPLWADDLRTLLLKLAETRKVVPKPKAHRCASDCFICEGILS